MRRHKMRENKFSIFPVIAFLILIYLFLSIFSGVSSYELLTFFTDLFIFIIFLLLSIFFFSQFVLPVSTIQERWSAFSRVILFILGKHGLMVKIENGVIKLIRKPSKENAPGVIWLDSASAGMLRNSTRYTRVIGPGVVFTDNDEVITDNIDLHIQKYQIGPLINENPFVIKQKIENQHSYDERVKRANQTKAISRDGIELIPTFTITFKLNSKTGEGKSGFGYNPLSVERAIIGQVLDSQQTEKKGENSLTWKLLPGYLVAEIFRDLVSKFEFNQIFHKENNGLEIILSNLQKRLSKPEAEEIDQFGKLTHEIKESLEFKILSSRGLIITEINLKHIWFPPEIETEMTNHWRRHWSEQEQSGRIMLEEVEKDAIEKVRNSAQIDFIASICDSVLEINQSNLVDKQRFVGQLISKIIGFVQSEPGLASVIPDELNQINKIHNQLINKISQ
jgi:hypothetical protein